MEAVFSPDLNSYALLIQQGGDPNIQSQLAVNALEKSRIFDAQVAVIVDVAMQNFSESIFLDVQA